MITWSRNLLYQSCLWCHHQNFILFNSHFLLLINLSYYKLVTHDEPYKNLAFGHSSRYYWNESLQRIICGNMESFGYAPSFSKNSCTFIGPSKGGHRSGWVELSINPTQSACRTGWNLSTQPNPLHLSIQPDPTRSFAGWVDWVRLLKKLFL